MRNGKTFGSDQAWIVEIFSSLQGEGIYLGEKQIFVRFGGCNLCCDYCDEPETIPIPSGKIWSSQDVRSEILRLSSREPHSSVSLTGGEPLLHAEFLKNLLPWIKAQGLKTYLETNGTLPGALESLKDRLDVVAMDVKLPSATGREIWALHEDFLKVAPEKTFVKIVLTRGSTLEEWQKAVSLIYRTFPEVPLILQPATSVASARDSSESVHPLPEDKVLEFLEYARGLIPDVRILPQQHPIWKVP